MTDDINFRISRIPITDLGSGRIQVGDRVFVMSVKAGRDWVKIGDLKGPDEPAQLSRALIEILEQQFDKIQWQNLSSLTMGIRDEKDLPPSLEIRQTLTSAKKADDIHVNSDSAVKMISAMRKISEIAQRRFPSPSHEDGRIPSEPSSPRVRGAQPSKRGLKNVGNSCFLNSALQMLKVIPGQPREPMIVLEEETPAALAPEIEGLFVQMDKDQKPAIPGAVMTPLLESFNQCTGSTKGDRTQRDSAEALQFLLNALAVPENIPVSSGDKTESLHILNSPFPEKDHLTQARNLVKDGDKAKIDAALGDRDNLLAKAQEIIEGKSTDSLENILKDHPDELKEVKAIQANYEAEARTMTDILQRIGDYIKEQKISQDVIETDFTKEILEPFLAIEGNPARYEQYIENYKKALPAHQSRPNDFFKDRLRVHLQQGPFPSNEVLGPIRAINPLLPAHLKIAEKKSDLFSPTDLLELGLQQNGYQIRGTPPYILQAFGRFTGEGKHHEQVDLSQPLHLPAAPEAKEPPREYSAKAIILHLGNRPTSGHYRALVRHDDDRWILYDDSYTQPVDEINLKDYREQAYVVLWELNE